MFFSLEDILFPEVDRTFQLTQGLILSYIFWRMSITKYKSLLPLALVSCYFALSSTQTQLAPITGSFLGFPFHWSSGIWHLLPAPIPPTPANLYIFAQIQRTFSPTLTNLDLQTDDREQRQFGERTKDSFRLHI